MGGARHGDSAMCCGFGVEARAGAKKLVRRGGREFFSDATASPHAFHPKARSHRSATAPGGDGQSDNHGCKHSGRKDGAERGQGCLHVPMKSATKDASTPCHIKAFRQSLRKISTCQYHRPQISSHNLCMHLRAKLANPFSSSHPACGALVQSNEVSPPRWMSCTLQGFVTRQISADR